MLTGENVNVHVLGMLVRRQDAHPDHEAFFIEAEREGDLLNTGDQSVPKPRITQTEIENRRNPLFWNDDDVVFPPLLFAAIDVVDKRKDVVVFVSYFIGFGSRAVEAASKSVLRVGLLPNALLLAANHLRNPVRHDHRWLQGLQAGVLLPAVKVRAMGANGRHDRLTPAKVLGAEPKWLKDRKHWANLVGDNEVVYEDHAVVVFHDPEDEEHESERIAGEIRLTLLAKKEGVESLMDLGVADEELSAAILHGIQQAALRLGLERKGFEVRAHVYPPLQRRPELAFKIRAGKPPKKSAAPAQLRP